jgi:hypothetical protein
VTNGIDSRAGRPWWESRWYVAALILLAFVPLVYPAVPPLVDLLGHMGRYRVQLDLANSPDLQRYFDFEWQLIGNLGVDLLIIPLSKLFGLELSVKLIAMSIPPLTVGGFLWVAREVHHRLPPTAAFALPFAFSHPFLFGFLNYTLSMALAFLAFGLWLRLARRGRLRLRALLFVPISFIVFICHTFGWGTLGLLCFSAEAVRQHDKGIAWWKSGIRAALHASVMIGPVFLMLAWRSDMAQGMTFDVFNLQVKALWVIMVLRDRWQSVDIAMLALPLTLLIFVWRRPDLAFSRNLAFSALVLFAGFMLLPRVVFGSAYADMRLMPFVIATAILAIRFRGETDLRLGQVLAIAGTGYYSLKLVLTTASLAIAANQQQAKLDALDRVPIGARVVNLTGEACGTLWALPRDSHLGAMAIVRREAFSNDQWAVPGANPLRVIYSPAGRFASDPSQMVRPEECTTPGIPSLARALRLLPRDAFDYLWLIDPPPHDPRLLDGLRPIWRGKDSALYAIERPAAYEAP